MSLRNMSDRYKDSKTPKLHRPDIYNSMGDLERFLHSRKIKYSILDKVIKHRIPSKTKSVNVFINVYDILSGIYAPNVMNSFNNIAENQRYMLTSELINIAAHMRSYFATRMSIYSNFVFYYSSKKCKRAFMINPEFKRSFYSKRIEDNPEYDIVNRIMRPSLKLAEIVCRYLPHVYFIDSKEIDSAVIPSCFLEIQKPEDNEFNIIYSNNKLDSLNLKYNNTIMLSCEGDNSKVYDKLNCIKLFSKAKGIDDTKVEFTLLPHAISISGFENFNMLGVKGYGLYKTVKLLNENLDNGNIGIIDYEINELCNKLQKIDNSDMANIEKNFNVIDLNTIYNNLTEADKLIIFGNIIDLLDKESLYKLNEDYFKINPIDFEGISQGEEYC